MSNFKLEKLVRENILNLTPYSSARDEYSKGAGTFLDANENPFGTYNRYPDPYQTELKNKLAEIKQVDTSNLFIGNGSDELIDLLFRIFCKPGKDKILTFSPTYGMYSVSAEINDIEVISMPLNADLQIDMESIQSLIKNPTIKMIFICSPNNPTGNSINKVDIESILQDFNGIVVLDEAYIDFSSQESFKDKISYYPNLVIMQTLSKAWGLASLRIGLGISSIEIIKLLNKVKPPYNISQANQSEALAALEKVAEQKISVSTILMERAKMIREFNQMDLVTKVYPSDANFLLVEVKDADYLYEQLLNNNIIVRNRSSVMNSCLRISIGTPKENQLLIQTLKRQATLITEKV